MLKTNKIANSISIMMEHIKAIIFDYDGVIANTMGDMFVAWNQVFKSITATTINRKEFFLLEGKTAREIAEIICSKHKINAKKINKLIEKKDEYYKIFNHFSLNPCIDDIINFLKTNRILTAIVSGAPKLRIRKMLNENFFSKFNCVIGAEDTKQSKPFPQPYLKALEKLNISAQNAIVIENAPLGIASAVSAGIYCVAVESTLPKKYLSHANKVLKNFEELYNFLLGII